MQFKKQKIKLLDSKTKERYKVDGYYMYLSLYQIHLEVVIGQKKQMMHFIDKCDGFVHTDTDNCSLLWVKDTRGSTLIHELYHLVNRITKSRGFHEDEDNEPQAYLMGWLYDEIKKLK